MSRVRGAPPAGLTRPPQRTYYSTYIGTVFADRIRTAKELNRRSGAILREAREHPVTIVTEGEAPVVIEARDRAAADFAARAWLVRVLPLLRYLHEPRGRRPPDEFSWVRELSRRSRAELATELPERLDAAARSGDFVSFDQWLYEWEVTREVEAQPALQRRLRAAARAAARVR